MRICEVLQGAAKREMLVVDVSLYGSDGTFFKCHKMPSGVLIQLLERNSMIIKELNNNEFLPCGDTIIY
jgi:hypothetical protein